jgi:cytochrome P450
MASTADWLTAPPPAADLATPVLSRHADVLAALRAPDLVQVGQDGDLDAALKREQGRLRVRADMASVLTRHLLAERRARMLDQARAAFSGLPIGSPVDLLEEFIQPWTRWLAVDIASAAAPQPAGLHTGSELKAFFRRNGSSAAEPLFMGASDTLRRFLGNAVIALLRHPERGAASTAVEELLRYAGPVHTLYRRAVRDVLCNGIVSLRLAAANRDPLVFPEPNRLDLTRRAPGHLALGAGPHSCPGAPLVRMALSVMLEAISESNITVDLAGPIEWKAGSTLFSPAAVPVILGQ